MGAFDYSPFPALSPFLLRKKGPDLKEFLFDVHYLSLPSLSKVKHPPLRLIGGA